MVRSQDWCYNYPNDHRDKNRSFPIGAHSNCQYSRSRGRSDFERVDQYDDTHFAAEGFCTNYQCLQKRRYDAFWSHRVQEYKDALECNDDELRDAWASLEEQASSRLRDIEEVKKTARERYPNWSGTDIGLLVATKVALMEIVNRRDCSSVQGWAIDMEAEMDLCRRS